MLVYIQLCIDFIEYSSLTSLCCGNYEICPFIVILSPFKRFPIQNGCFYDMFDVYLMDEMENNTFAPRLHLVCLKHMLVSAAAYAPTNRALNKTLPGTVSFFIVRLYANFSSTKITSPTKINAKTRK